jgi:hypothetical protein
MNQLANDMEMKGTRRLRDMNYDCNALKTARLSRTAYEWHRVGLRVSDKTGEAKRNVVLERRRWLKRKSNGPLGQALTISH